MQSFIQRFSSRKECSVEEEVDRYIHKLGPLLRKRYKPSKHYTEEQIGQTIRKHRLAGGRPAYAYALYANPEELSEILINLGEARSGTTLRKFLGERFVGGDANYTADEIAAVVSRKPALASAEA